MVKDLYYLDVAGPGQGDDVVACAETWVEPAVLELRPEQAREPLGLSFESVGSSSEHDVVDVHAHHCAGG